VKRYIYYLGPLQYVAHDEIKASRHKYHSNPKFGILLTFLFILKTVSVYSYGPMNFTKVSYVGLQCQNFHQNRKKLLKPVAFDIVDLPVHPDGLKSLEKSSIIAPRS